ncbi:hypothetical protein L6452_40456 [Arctium lappa]|uniref:Uncharacterized protein n=1 Tax=Arctium lappa TaxID=4217 RepID=A0ACB8XR38_ARCLA|nr:hypothetical protein L6452_40456 [Arctium lappa]
MSRPYYTPPPSSAASSPSRDHTVEEQWLLERSMDLVKNPTQFTEMYLERARSIWQKPNSVHEGGRRSMLRSGFRREAIDGWSRGFRREAIDRRELDRC